MLELDWIRDAAHLLLAKFRDMRIVVGASLIDFYSRRFTDPKDPFWDKQLY
jgi:hypothetical protein